MGGELNVKDLSNKYWEKELELREKELALIFGRAKELELIFQPKRNWNILKGIDPITEEEPFSVEG